MEPKIIFEDANLLVLDKPAGLVVHEGAGQTQPTLVDWLKRYLSRSPLARERFGLLHRLDKETSGLLLVAKTRPMFDYLKQLFKQRQIAKEYLVLVHGRLVPEKGLIQIPLSRHIARRTKFEPAASGRLAETAYQVKRYYPCCTYLSAYPKTGRTHQLRVHFSSLRHPVAGDKVYGKTDLAPRQFLHAHQISFTDQKGKLRKFISPLPPDLQKFLDSSR